MVSPNSHCYCTNYKWFNLMSFTGKLTIHPHDYAYQNAYETLIRRYATYTWWKTCNEIVN